MPRVAGVAMLPRQGPAEGDGGAHEPAMKRKNVRGPYNAAARAARNGNRSGGAAFDLRRVCALGRRLSTPRSNMFGTQKKEC